MDRQDELLEKEDGRYFAIDKFGTGLATIATTERLQKEFVGFGLPSGPALFLHLAYRSFLDIKDISPLSLFDTHEQGIWPDNSGPLFDFFENFISHVVFSFTALEAFANEVIPEGFVYTFTVESTDEEKSYGKDDIERRVNLDEKLHTILPAICAVASPKGTHIWEKYKKIKKIRDRIIHLKSIDRKASGPEDETIWGTMLRLHDNPFCDYAYQIISHFKPAIQNRRWHKEYPYAK